jgi:DNA-binding NarL/FixJ family response regulator
MGVVVTPVLDKLTTREESVLLVYAEGGGLGEAASRLGISELQARRARDRARLKLGACNTTAAVVQLVLARTARP